MVYTRKGDEGRTDLMNGGRVSKTNVRIEAYGTVDEVNSCIGMVRPIESEDVSEVLKKVQNHLHIIQSELSNPDAGENDDYPQVNEEHVLELEEYIDTFREQMEPTQQFILPGGSEVGSQIHFARSVCRRAERRVTALSEEEDINGNILNYINRLSDLLFVVARLRNDRQGVEEEHPSY